MSTLEEPIERDELEGERATSAPASTHSAREAAEVFEEAAEQDDAEAMKWYRKAAEQGDADAQYILGVRYRYGKGVEQDNEQAVRWFKLAAEQGHNAAE